VGICFDYGRTENKMMERSDIVQRFYTDELYHAMHTGDVDVIADEVRALMLIAYREGYRAAIKGMAEG
jgi:hypothetical protein